MIWKPLLWPAHHLLLFLFGAALATFLSARNRQPARCLIDGRTEFAHSKVVLVAWSVIVFLLAYHTIGLLRHSEGKPLDLVHAACPGLLALLLFFGFPGTVVISSDGLQQVRWFWPNIRIQWEEIVVINTGEKSRTVTIIGSNGAKIVHSRQLADRSRLLLELKQHCGESLPPDFPREPIIP